MREEVCGYSDEDTEDVTFRRLMSPDSASRDIHGATALETAILQQVCMRVFAVGWLVLNCTSVWVGADAIE